MRISCPLPIGSMSLTRISEGTTASGDRVYARPSVGCDTYDPLFFVAIYQPPFGDFWVDLADIVIYIYVTSSYLTSIPAFCGVSGWSALNSPNIQVTICNLSDCLSAYELLNGKSSNTPRCSLSPDERRWLTRQRGVRRPGERLKEETDRPSLYHPTVLGTARSRAAVSDSPHLAERSARTRTPPLICGSAAGIRWRTGSGTPTGETRLPVGRLALLCL